MQRNLAQRYASLASYLLIVFIPLLLFWRLVFAGEVLYWGVPLTQFYPWHTLINQALASGCVPLWTDLLGNGAPLMANHQTALFYPPNLLFRLLPVEHVLGYTVVLHVIGAGLAALYWGRTLGLGWPGRTVLALSYALGGYVMGRTQFITMVAAYAWLPLLLALTERLMQRHRAVDGVWLGAVLALQFLAGHAQIWFYSLLLVLVYGAYRVWRGRNEWRVRAAALLALAVLLSLGLSAIQLLPTAELAVNSQRSGGTDWDFAMTYSYWPWRLLTLLAPDLYGNPALGNYAGYATYWEDHAYVGLLPLIFALAAVAGWVRRTVARHATAQAGIEIQREPQLTRDEATARSAIPFFAVLSVLALILAMGNRTPVFPLLFNYVPGFGLFQAPARLMLWFAIGASTLAGMGVDSFRLSYRSQYVLRLSAAGAGAMLVVALAMDGAGVAPGRIYAPALVKLAVLSGLACVLLLLHGREADDSDARVKVLRLPRMAWRGLVVALIGADLLLSAAPLTPTITADLYRSANPAGSILDADASQVRLHADLEYQYGMSFDRYFRFGTFGPSDLAYWLGLRDSLLPNLNAVDGIASTGNNEPLVVGRWRAIVEQTRRADAPVLRRLLGLMNAGLMLTDKPAADWLRVGAVPDLYRVPDPLPRAWMVPDAEMVADADGLLARLTDPAFDPRQTVLIEMPSSAPTHVQGEAVEPGGAGAVSLHEDWNSRTIRLTASRSGYLVLAYTWYPGWQATVDGQPAQILRANYAFMAVPVASGPHEVALAYRPAIFTWGAVVTCLAALATVGLCVRHMRRRE